MAAPIIGKLEHATPDETTNFLAQLVEPKTVLNIALSKTYCMQYKTPAEFCEEYSGLTFDFNALAVEFKKVCADYTNNLGWNNKYACLDFAARVLFEVGPETRKVRKETGDKKWRFLFCANDKKPKYAFVCTYKGIAPPTSQPVTTDDKIVLTVKQASLLSLYVLSGLSKIALEHEYTVLTPLAGAIFSKNDMKEISFALHSRDDIDYIAATITTINNSCQSGGHYLPGGRSEIAVLAAISATRNMKDKSMRRSIIVKTFKQYTSKSSFDVNIFKRLSPYATGGIPHELSPENLIEMHETEVKMNFKRSRELSNVLTTTMAQNVQGTVPRSEN